MAVLNDKTWTNCVKWFTDVRLIPTSHFLNSDRASCVDLAKFLRDGSMLCKLLSLLDEDSIEMHTVYLRPRNAQVLSTPLNVSFKHKFYLINSVLDF